MQASPRSAYSAGSIFAPLILATVASPAGVSGEVCDCPTSSRATRTGVEARPIGPEARLTARRLYARDGDEAVQRGVQEPEPCDPDTNRAQDRTVQQPEPWHAADSRGLLFGEQPSAV
jgi:hypothetical protein